MKCKYCNLEYDDLHLPELHLHEELHELFSSNTALRFTQE